MGEIRENVQKNLGYYLTLRGISQKKLAEMLHVSQSAVTNWIKGKNSPDIEIVADICNILDISVTQLFGTEEPENYTLLERTLILRYRERPELQHAINILLNIDEQLFKTEEKASEKDILRDSTTKDKKSGGIR